MTALKRPIAIAALSLLAASAPPGSAYGPVEQSWLEGEATFYIGDLGSPWRGAFEEAVARWDDTAVNIDINLVNGGTTRSCDLDDRNGAWWTDADCEGPWDDTTLAITYFWFFENNGALVEADIIYNETVNWDIYDGNERPSADFRRVSVHELGHAFGASHSKLGNAIMNAFIGDIFLPRQDDIDALTEGGDYGTDPNYTLTIEVEGDGRVEISTRVPGTLVANNGSLQCDSNCQRSFQEGLRLDVFAQANAGQRFEGWQGINGCNSLPGCQLAPLSGNRTITAVFSGNSTGGSKPGKTVGVDASDKTLKNKIKITWDETAGASRYDIRRKPQGGSWSLLADTSGLQSVDRDVTNQRQYLYQVRACNSEGCGSWSSKDGGKAKFKKVSNVSATDGNFSNRVTITWKNDSRAEFYQVRRSKRSSGGFSTVGTPTEAKLVDFSAVQGTTYFYKVRACNDFGCGNNSATESGFARE